MLTDLSLKVDSSMLAKYKATMLFDFNHRDERLHFMLSHMSKVLSDIHYFIDKLSGG